MKHISKLTATLLLTGLITTTAIAETKAIVVLMPTQGHKVTGIVTYTETSEGVKVVADVTGLRPGPHGFHIHEFGDCSAPDGMSAGGHFNPYNKSHGGPDVTQRHEGDLGNIMADANGRAHYERLDKMVSLKGRSNIFGRSVIIHTDRDDFTTQPTGDAGARVACGVVGIAKP